MRLRDLLEAPIGDFGTIGDFSDPNASIPNASDRRAVTAEPLIKRIKTAWERTPFVFNLFFANVPGMERYVETGYVRDSTIQREFPEMADRIMAGQKNKSITVVFTNNRGDEGVSFTPWIIAHRISHSLVIMNNSRDPRQGVQNKAFYSGSERLFEFDRKIMSYVRQYHEGLRLDDDFTRMVYEHLGTMKSARTKKLSRPTEFYHELFAQYMLTGDIQFNSFDKAFMTKVSDLIVAESELTSQDLSEMNTLLAELKTTLINSFTKGLQHAQGRVIFM